MARRQIRSSIRRCRPQSRLSLQNKFSQLRFASLMTSLEPTTCAPSPACSVMSQPWQQRQNSKGNHSTVAYCEGFRTQAVTNISARTTAGVRKPPRDETAGGGTCWAVPHSQLWDFGRGRATSEVGGAGRRGWRWRCSSDATHFSELRAGVWRNIGVAVAW